MNSLSQVDIEESVNGLYNMSYPKRLLALGRGSSRMKLCVKHKRQTPMGVFVSYRTLLVLGDGKSGGAPGGVQLSLKRYKNNALHPMREN